MTHCTRPAIVVLDGKAQCLHHADIHNPRGYEGPAVETGTRTCETVTGITKPIVELECGQRYSETYDMDEVYTLISVTDAQDPDRIWVNYLDADKVTSRSNSPRTAQVFPVGPAPSAVAAAIAQLNRELNHPAMIAAINAPIIGES